MAPSPFLSRSTTFVWLIVVKMYDIISAAKPLANVDHPECRLFLAESTIPNAGLGIFTGIDLSEGDFVAEPDIVVPIIDWSWNAEIDADFHFLWIDYSWLLSEVGMETDTTDGFALVLGTGCMPNCNYALINAYEGEPSYDHVGLHRSKDSGITGFTGFHNQRMIASQYIPKGGEIFVAYGESWFHTRPESMGTVPLSDNFDIIDSFLKKFKKLRGKYQRSHNPDFAKDLWEALSFVHSYESRNTNALPRTFDDLQSALSVGSANSFLPYSVRTLDWLNEHGRCMDNIRPGNSTIEQAGRGAFAARFISKGGLVAPGPLLHIPNKTALNIYQMDPSTGNRDTNLILGQQLIINYCFGHKRSTLLLCPYTSPSAYINHCSKSPNAKVVWAKESTHNHRPDWLQEDINFLKTVESIGLSIDFIATRDIHPGEEVLIDYGAEWEDAWYKYIKQWKPPEESENYIAGSEIQNDFSIPLRTIEEQQLQPYSVNIIFYCHYVFSSYDTEDSWKWDAEWGELPLYPCKIISRSSAMGKDGNTLYHYDVMMLTAEEIDRSNIFVNTEELIPKGIKHSMTDVPRSAIKVRDKMYTKDEFLPHSFRHEMMMPDDLFPESWRNL